MRYIKLFDNFNIINESNEYSRDRKWDTCHIEDAKLGQGQKGPVTQTLYIYQASKIREKLVANEHYDKSEYFSGDVKWISKDSYNFERSVGKHFKYHKKLILDSFSNIIGYHLEYFRDDERKRIFQRDLELMENNGYTIEELTDGFDTLCYRFKSGDEVLFNTILKDDSTGVRGRSQWKGWFRGYYANRVDDIFLNANDNGPESSGYFYINRPELEQLIKHNNLDDTLQEFFEEGEHIIIDNLYENKRTKGFYRYGRSWYPKTGPKDWWS
jgi:hypothetical protein